MQFYVGWPSLSETHSRYTSYTSRLHHTTETSFLFYNGCVLLCESVAWYSHVLFIFRIAKSRLYLSKGNTRNYEWIRTLTCYLCTNVSVAWMLDIFWLLVRMRTRKACKYRASQHSFINYLLPTFFFLYSSESVRKDFSIVYRCYLYGMSNFLSQLTVFIYIRALKKFLSSIYIYLYIYIYFF